MEFLLQLCFIQEIYFNLISYIIQCILGGFAYPWRQCL